MHRDGNRTHRIASTIKQQLATLIRENYPREWQNILFSITHIRVSPDLSFADIYCSSLDLKKTRSMVEQLEEDKKQIRHTLLHSVTLKKFPVLRFHIDKVRESSSRIEKLLGKSNQGSSD